jgi:hypothetical protein
VTHAAASTTILNGAAGRVLQRAIGGAKLAWARGEFDGFDSGGSGSRRGAGRRDGMDTTWVNVAVRRIAEEAGYMPWRLVADDDELIERGPLYDLLMVRPNDEQDPRAFVESIVISLLTSVRGSVVVIKDFGLERVAFDAGRPRDYQRLLPRQVLVADSTRFRAVWRSATGGVHPRIDHYEYVVPSEGGFGGGTIKFLPEEVVVIGLPRGAERLAAIDGLPVRTAGAEAERLDREMLRFAEEYFAHNGQPGTVLTTDSALTPQQAARMRRDWDERHRGRSWRTAVLHKGTKLAGSDPVKDTAMPELAKQVRERILALYGVPPIVAGIVDDANRSNSDAQTAFFVLGAVASVCDRIDGALTRGLVAAHDWPAPSGSGAGRARIAMSNHRREVTRSARIAAHRLCEENRRLQRAIDNLPADSARKRIVFNPLSGGPERRMSLLHDVDTHPSVARMKIESLAAALQLVNHGQPLNDVLDLLDIQIERRPEGDVARVPFSVAPASSIDDFDPGEPQEGETPDVQVEVEQSTDERGNPRTITRTRRTRTHRDAPSTENAADKRRGAEVRAPSAPAAAAPPPPPPVSPPAPPAKCRSAATFAVADLMGALAREYPESEQGCSCGAGGGNDARGLAERHRATWAPIARQMEAAIRKHLRAQRDALLARVRSSVKPEDVDDAPTRATPDARASIPESELDRILFDLSVERGKLVAAVRPAIRTAALLGAAQGASEAGLSTDAAAKAARLLIDDPRVRLALDKVGARLRIIEGRRLQEVKAVIRDAFEDPSKGFNDLLQGLKKYYDGEFTAARRAALTESAGVLNTARHEGMRSEGVDGKLWITASGRPRASHAQAQRDYGTTPIPIDQPFVVGGASLRYPADPDAPAGERINCFCLQLAAFLEDGDNTRSARAAEIRFLTLAEIGL